MPTPTAVPCCHHCGSPLPAERPSRRDVCSSCGHEVRACANCAFYAPGSHNDCREPGAERVLDKERANFCEYFSLDAGRPAAGQGKGSGDARAALEALFRKD